MITLMRSRWQGGCWQEDSWHHTQCWLATLRRALALGWRAGSCRRENNWTLSPIEAGYSQQLKFWVSECAFKLLYVPSSENCDIRAVHNNTALLIASHYRKSEKRRFSLFLSSISQLVSRISLKWALMHTGHEIRVLQTWQTLRYPCGRDWRLLKTLPPRLTAMSPPSAPHRASPLKYWSWQPWAHRNWPRRTWEPQTARSSRHPSVALARA